MQIDEKEIGRLAELARLELTEEERRELAPQIASIIAYVEQLNEVDTSSVEPSIGGLLVESKSGLSQRSDEAKVSLGQQLALDQAPEPVHGHFQVPKVI
ncbi:MAG: Asp-tRNA(Asn)/Glu-tRNA(Gln) amidotransferase subunit GatC [Pyrinomonadaceae bacterium]